MYSYQIEQAIKAASILHAGQLRKGEIEIPYISHIMAVTLILRDYTEDEATLTACLLHDTIEDTDYTLKELTDDFGKDVAEIVAAITEPAVEKTTWKQRKAAYHKQLKKGPEAALMIAAADKIHNLRGMVEQYAHDHTRFINDFGGNLEERLQQYQAISNVLNARLKNDIVHEFNHVFTEFKTFIEDAKNTQENAKKWCGWTISS